MLDMVYFFSYKDRLKKVLVALKRNEFKFYMLEFNFDLLLPYVEHLVSSYYLSKHFLTGIFLYQVQPPFCSLSTNMLGFSWWHLPF